MADKTWTDERVAQLQELWKQGLSASQCAAYLTQFWQFRLTKNAVIGITNRRRDLFSMRKAPQKDNYTIKRRPKNSKVVKRAYHKQAIMSCVPIAVGVLPLFADDVVLAPFPWPVPVTPLPGCGIMGLSDAVCRWPIGEEFPQRFCGELTDNKPPYCPEHRERAYQSWRRYG